MTVVVVQILQLDTTVAVIQMRKQDMTAAEEHKLHTSVVVVQMQRPNMTVAMEQMQQERC